MAKRLSKEQIDIPCRGCGKCISVMLYVPPTHHPDHVESILKQLHKKGWTGDHATRLRCKTCSKSQQKKGQTPCQSHRDSLFTFTPTAALQ